MIVDIFLQLINLLLTGILQVVSSLPDVSLGQNSVNFLSAINDAKNYAMMLIDVVPLVHILVAFGAVLAVRHAIIVWSGVNWGLRRLPTQS
jgi:hypothetical protein